MVLVAVIIKLLCDTRKVTVPISTPHHISTDKSSLLSFWDGVTVGGLVVLCCGLLIWNIITKRGTASTGQEEGLGINGQGRNEVTSGRPITEEVKTFSTPFHLRNTRYGIFGGELICLYEVISRIYSYLYKL